VEVESIGRFDHWGEFWRLVYDGCGHATQLPREMGYDNWEYTARVIRESYAECQECRWDAYDRKHPQPEPEPEPSPPNPFWWLQDVHADRHPVGSRPRAAPVALHQVVIEGIFPDLVRLRLPDWSDDVPLYVERKRLPPEVDAHLLDAGYRFAVDADLDALTPEELIESLHNWRAERSR
jgi:hypothetical protein